VADLDIAHDLSTAAPDAQRVAVMYLGRTVETRPSRNVVTHPRHPYTQTLVSGVPRRDRGRRMREILTGEIPNGMTVPRFAGSTPG
jgi:ABC-type dipeptide/oligopeptide/nickel transport system ATPase component